MIKKTKNIRLEEVLDLRKKLQNLGYNASHAEVKRLIGVLSDFVARGEYIKDRFVIEGYDQVIWVRPLIRLRKLCHPVTFELGGVLGTREYVCAPNGPKKGTEPSKVRSKVF